ncbi:MAG: 2-hydroxyacyl-CoA dehydratase family protein [Clostridiales bacterium]|nr:2-hydroxyacyl-CoA dehydratase family protein [Clostridiales bacterium]
MAYRKEAMNSPAFRTLLYAYEHPDEVLFLSDKPLVWILGIDVPEEIILAADMMPAKVMGYQAAKMPYADKYLEFSFGPIWRGIFEKIMRLSAAGKMDYLACGVTSDMNFKIYNYITEMRRKGYEPYLPQTYYVDFELNMKNVRVQERNEMVVRKFIRQMEIWSGKKLERINLEHGIKLCNDYRAVMREFDAVRTAKQSRITGSEALAVIGGSMFMNKERAMELVHEVTESARSWPVAEGSRTYFTGCFQETPEVYDLIEQSGGNVVFEDHEMGTRSFDNDVDTAIDPIFGIAARYHNRIPSSERSTPNPRAELIGKLVPAMDIQSFLVYMNIKDECWLWDYPKQKVILDKLGVKSLVIERQDYPIKEKAELQRQLQAFYSGKEV